MSKVKTLGCIMAIRNIMGADAFRVYANKHYTPTERQRIMEMSKKYEKPFHLDVTDEGNKEEL